jgi:hypothetical protein
MFADYNFNLMFGKKMFVLFQSPQPFYEKKEGSGRPKNIRIRNTARKLSTYLEVKGEETRSRE